MQTNHVKELQELIENNKDTINNIFNMLDSAEEKLSTMLNYFKNIDKRTDNEKTIMEK